MTLLIDKQNCGKSVPNTILDERRMLGSFSFRQDIIWHGVTSLKRVAVHGFIILIYWVRGCKKKKLNQNLCRR